MYLILGYEPNTPVLARPRLNENGSGIILSWSVTIERQRPVDYYILFWRENNRRDDGSNTEKRNSRDENSVTVTDSNYNFVNTSEETIYAFSVKAVNDHDRSDLSNVEEFDMELELRLLAERLTKESKGLAGWLIVLIVILCCLCCCICYVLFCLLCCCILGRRKRTYHAEEEGMGNRHAYLCI